MLVKFSTFAFPTYLDINYGELVSLLSSNALYAKNLNSDITRLGNSLYTLLEFEDFYPLSLNDNSIVQFVLNELNELTLGTNTLPFISIKNLEESNISSIVNNNYLQFLDNELISNQPPSFRLGDLTEVNILNRSEAVDNFVVTWRVTSFIDPIDYVINDTVIKDYYFRSGFGEWRLLPETSKIVSFDDVRNNSTVPYSVLTNTLKQIQPPEAGVAHTRPFRISYDRNPQLSNHINISSHSIFNHQYRTIELELDNNTETISVNPSLFSCYVIKCTNVLSLNIALEVAQVTDSLQTVILDIREFEGVLSFPSWLKFENGEAPALLGKNTVFSIMLYTASNGIEGICTQKINNIKRAS